MTAVQHTGRWLARQKIQTASCTLQASQVRKRNMDAWIGGHRYLGQSHLLDESVNDGVGVNAFALRLV